MIEYSPLPGTCTSNTREGTDEPCTKNTTGCAGSPCFGGPSRLRNIHKGTSPFLAQYSPLQIALVSGVSGVSALAGSAWPSVPATRPRLTPRPAPLRTVRRGSGLLGWVMLFPLSALLLVFDRSIVIFAR